MIFSNGSVRTSGRPRTAETGDADLLDGLFTTPLRHSVFSAYSFANPVCQPILGAGAGTN